MVMSDDNASDSPGRRLSISLKYTSAQSKEEGERLFREADKQRLSFQGCRIFRLCSREKTDQDRFNTCDYSLVSQPCEIIKNPK